MNALKNVIFCTLLTATLACAAASGDEANIRQALQAKLRMNAESVTPTPFAGVYEVVVNGQIFYTDAKASYMFKGDLVDMRGVQPKNLTEEASAKLAATTLSKSTDLAVKRVKGNGKRVVYTFEDPNCGYCKELQKELAKMNDVTIYTFLWPILSQDSLDKSKAIWCSRDRAKAWEDYMLRGASPGSKRDCDTTALERNQRLAQRFGLRGTPAVYLANGEQVGGYLPADRLEAALAANR
ncbi:MAG TPA: DsbC family protein [Burkholderiales bacterium]|nr:DsbC family protein [Burkholderiales bacterium]